LSYFVFEVIFVLFTEWYQGYCELEGKIKSRKEVSEIVESIEKRAR